MESYDYLISCLREDRDTYHICHIYRWKELMHEKVPRPFEPSRTLPTMKSSTKNEASCNHKCGKKMKNMKTIVTLLSRNKSSLLMIELEQYLLI